MKNFSKQLLHRIGANIGIRTIEVKLKSVEAKLESVESGLQACFSANNLQISQTQLTLKYQELLRTKKDLPRLRDTGFRVYSAGDEDGILLYIFALLGTTNKICADIAFGVPYGANTTNLVCNRGWTGLLTDGADENIRQSRQFFATHPDTWAFPPKTVCAWFTSKNVNQIIQENGFSGEIDLLSLDVDGIDYWLWKNLEIIRPRVVVLEYMGYWGPEKSVTVPDIPDFNRLTGPEDDYSYQGASLPAFVKLAHQKGYRLIGCNQLGNNAFFIQDGLGEDIFPAIDVAECCNQPRNIERMKTVLPKALQYEWEEV